MDYTGEENGTRTDADQSGLQPEFRVSFESLAEQCEQAPAADSDIDALIWCLCSPKGRDYLRERGTPERAVGFEFGCEAIRNGVPIYGLSTYAGPRYTASLDAAMTLVPEGWDLHLRGHFCAPAGDQLAMLTDKAWLDEEPHGNLIQGDSKTLALALCAAALRARASLTA